MEERSRMEGKSRIKIYLSKIEGRNRMEGRCRNRGINRWRGEVEWRGVVEWREEVGWERIRMERENPDVR